MTFTGLIVVASRSVEEAGRDGEFIAWHLHIVAVVFVLLFGAAKLPVFATFLGESLRIFKRELHAEENRPVDPLATPTPASAGAGIPATAGSAPGSAPAAPPGPQPVDADK